MTKLFQAFAIFTFVGVASTAGAVMLEVVPASATVTAGDTLDVDIVIGGLGATGAPSLGAFDLDLSFDSLLLSPTMVNFGILLGDPALFEALTSFSFLPGVVDLAETSLLSPADLDTRQDSSFVVASVSFSALSSGSSNLLLSQIVLADAFGQPLTVDIPEPASLLLLVGGLVGLGGRIRRSRRP